MSRVQALFENFLLNDCMTIGYFVPDASALILDQSEIDNATIVGLKRNRRREFMTMVGELESIPKFHYPTVRATRLWLRTYNAENFFSDDERDFWTSSGIAENLLSTTIEPYWTNFTGYLKHCELARENGHTFTAT
jgi:hypothetical protein